VIAPQCQGALLQMKIPGPNNWAEVKM